MPLNSDFNQLADNGFGSGSEQGGLQGVKFGTLVNDIQAGDPVFAEHVLRLYQVLSGDTENAEVGLDGLLATQNLKVNQELTVFDLEVEGTLELAANLTVPENLEVGESFDFSDGSGSFGSNVAQAFAGIADNSQDVSVASSGGDVQLTLNSNTVDQNELDAGSGPGFLLLNGGSLAWEGFRTSSEFTGDGTPGNQLGIANNSIDNAELAQMSNHSVKTGDGNGDPTDQSIGQNELVARTTGSVEGLSVASSTLVGRTSSGNLAALSAGDAKGVLNIQASDISADSTGESRFQGSNSFRFRDQLIMERGALISSDAQDQTTNVTIRQNADNSDSVITFENTDVSEEAYITARWSGIGFEELEIESASDIRLLAGSGSIDSIYMNSTLTIETSTTTEEHIELKDSQGNVVDITYNQDTLDVDFANRINLNASQELVSEGTLTSFGGRTFDDSGNEFSFSGPDVMIYKGVIIFRNVYDDSDLDDSFFQYNGANLLKEGDAGIYAKEGDSSVDPDFGFFERKNGDNGQINTYNLGG